MNTLNGPADTWQRGLQNAAAELGLVISDAEAAAFHTHLRLLLAHNQRAGLTTITDPVEIAVKHFLDSLSGLLLRDIRAGERVADVGSGGGFPGAVLAVTRPAASFVLIESSRKRAVFLLDLIETLGLRNASVVSARAEDIGRHSDHRGGYDLALSRAVAPMPVLLEYCLPLVSIGGNVLAYKGPEAEAEIAESAMALETLGGRVVQTRRFSLPLNMGDRVLVLVEKARATPPSYPRRPGMPSKRPLAKRDAEREA